MGAEAARGNTAAHIVDAESGRFPTPLQRLLILASVGEGDVARTAWAEWRGSGDIDHVDSSSSRLLPQTYRNLTALGVDDARLERLREIYRREWFANQVLAQIGAGAIRRLEEARVPTLVLKGAALGPLHYGDLGARPMGDLDVLVPRARIRDAMRTMRESGFFPASTRAPEKLIAVIHAEPFVGSDGQIVDLHWYATWQPADDSDFWAGSIPFVLAGVETRALNPADQLLHVCVHGANWDASSAIRWVADALTVIGWGRGGVDWARLVERAQARRMTVGVTAALDHLARAYDAPVPADALASLRRHRGSLLERLAFSTGAKPPPRAANVSIYLDRYRRLRALDDPDADMGFVRFVARSRGQTSRELATSVARRHVGRRLRRLV